MDKCLDKQRKDVMSHTNKTVEQCYTLVRHFFKDEPGKVNVWFTTPNPFLGHISPQDMINVGQEHKLLNWIKSNLSGQDPTDWC